MKKSSKMLLALLALAATATPALAIEHQLSGRFATFYEVSNYAATGTVANDAPTANWFDQRLRLAYAAKASNDVKLVSKFELDYSFWGNSDYVTGRNQGGGIGADSVNIETKNLYLDWSIPAERLNAKIGMQGYDDAFSGIMFSSDMAGVLLTHDCSSNLTTSVGFFRWEDNAGIGQGGSNTPTSVPGRNTQDLLAITGSYNLDSKTKVGGAYYYINDDTNPAGQAKVHTLGVNAATSAGAVNLSAFAVIQSGDFDATTDAKGKALKVAANTALGEATLRADLLYVGGGKNQLYVTRDGNGYYDNELMIISRDKNATTIDNALVYTLNNNSEGVIMAALGFDQPLSSTLSASANLGFAQVADNQGGAGIDPKEDYIGTEVNVEVNKKATDNITLTGRAGYVLLGDHYAGNPDNPFAVQCMVAYKF